MRDLNLKAMEHLETVARLGTATEAIEGLAVSPSAIRQQTATIKTLSLAPRGQAIVEAAVYKSSLGTVTAASNTCLPSIEGQISPYATSAVHPAYARPENMSDCS